MIFIFSVPFDFSTDEVAKWIKHLGGEFIRVNRILPDDTYSFNYTLDSSGNSFSVTYEGKEINGDEIGSFWYRRSAYFPPFDLEEIGDRYLRGHLLDINNTEGRSLLRGFYGITDDRYWLSNPENSSVTKLACLEKARQAGMKIPRTIVATRKAEIAKLLQEGQYITKPMYEVRTMEIDNKKFVPWTRKLTADDIKDLPELIYPSLVQECVEKQFELRVFVLEDEIFPMTIFSQAYEETSVDFRASGPSNYMRKSPITLPKELNNSIRKFMKLMALNTGSIDILYSTTGEYYFLEVNPVGQFGMTSVPCNYFLEKRIAQLLIDKDNEFKRR